MTRVLMVSQSDDEEEREALLLVPPCESNRPLPKNCRAALFSGDGEPDGDRIGLLIRPGNPGCRTCYLLRRGAIIGTRPPVARIGDDALAGLHRTLREALAGETELPSHPGLVILRGGQLRVAHRLLPRPDCPDCGGGWGRPVPPATLEDLSDPMLGPLAKGRLIARGEAPFHIHVASARTHNSFIRVDAMPDFAWGRGHNAAAAARGALFEAAENYANALWTMRAVTQIRVTDQNGPELVCTFTSDGRLRWIRRDIETLGLGGRLNGSVLSLPVRSVVSDAHPHCPRPHLAESRTGFGAGKTLAWAQKSACAELSERFALARAWAVGSGGRRLERLDLPAEAVERLVRDGIDVDGVTFDGLPGSGAEAVAVARLRARHAPFESVGAAARATVSDAAGAALAEALQVRVGLVTSLCDPQIRQRCQALASGKQAMENAFDRALALASGHRRAARDRFFSAKGALPPLPPGIGIALVDLTTPDLSAAGCHVAKAVGVACAEMTDEIGETFAEPFLLA